MKAKVLYFGVIAELRGKNSENLEHSQTHLHDLKADIIKNTPGLEDVNFQLAVNQQMTTENVALQEGNEISFFPPFAGG